MNKGNKSGKNAPEQPESINGFPAEDVICSDEDYNKDLKQRIEEKTNSKVIKYEELIIIAPDFAIWLKEIVRYGNVDSQAIILSNLNGDDNNFRVTIYTNDHCYAFYGYAPSENKPDGYLGAGVTTRKPRVGEDWNRGNDLPDGKYCKKTFDAIVKRIVAFELKNLQLWR